jgi:hypothetical protein
LWERRRLLRKKLYVSLIIEERDRYARELAGAKVKIAKQERILAGLSGGMLNRQRAANE